MPVSRLENGTWPHPARLPLGAGWCGHCTAPGHEGQFPAHDILEAFCNLGYASSCAWSPPDRPADAVRFAVLSPPKQTLVDARERQSTAETLLVLRYVYERNHMPASHGDLKFDLSTGAWLERHQDPRIQKMAECFLESYLRKKG